MIHIRQNLPFLAVIFSSKHPSKPERIYLYKLFLRRPLNFLAAQLNLPPLSSYKHKAYRNEYLYV